MGVTLSRAAHWTSAQGATKGKLEFSSINQYILNEITQFVNEFAGKYPNEANYQFKKSLEWTTKDLTLSMFTGNYSTKYLKIIVLILIFSYLIVVTFLKLKR
jgi:hypothetical protein